MALILNKFRPARDNTDPETRDIVRKWCEENLVSYEKCMIKLGFKPIEEEVFSPDHIREVNGKIDISESDFGGQGHIALIYAVCENLKAVNYALISIDKDSTVSRTIEYISKNIHGHLTFFNSGDSATPNRKELHTCKKYRINYAFLPLAKLTSSSKILNEHYLPITT